MKELTCAAIAAMKAPYFKKKPLVIQALQYKGSISEISEIFLDLKIFRKEEFCCYIETLEGVMCCDINDWIIKGITGEFYPCKNDIFKASYDLCEPSGEKICSLN
jgi:hypothetical protein